MERWEWRGRAAPVPSGPRRGGGGPRSGPARSPGRRFRPLHQGGMTPMASAYTLEFEKPLLELERQIEDLKRIGTERQIDIDGDLEGLKVNLDPLRADIYRNPPPNQRVRGARHP